MQQVFGPSYEASMRFVSDATQLINMRLLLNLKAGIRCIQYVCTSAHMSELQVFGTPYYELETQI